MPLSQNVDPNPRWLRQDFTRFQELIPAGKSPVVLVEGSRNVPVEFQSKIGQLATHLIKAFPPSLPTPETPKVQIKPGLSV